MPLPDSIYDHNNTELDFIEKFEKLDLKTRMSKMQEAIAFILADDTMEIPSFRPINSKNKIQ